MATENLQLPHALTLNERNHLTMTGVAEVVSFDDTAVILRTSLGTLVVQGIDLRLKNLSPDGGQLAVDGQVCSLCYQQERGRGFGRFFR